MTCSCSTRPEQRTPASHSARSALAASASLFASLSACLAIMIRPICGAGWNFSNSRLNFHRLHQFLHVIDAALEHSALGVVHLDLDHFLDAVFSQYAGDPDDI